MKRAALSLLLVTTCASVPRVASAQYAGAVAAGTTAGLLASQQRYDVPLAAPIGKPLGDWTDPATSSTSAVAVQCSQVFEAELFGTHVRNFVVLSTTNDGKVPASLDTTGVFARFGGGLSRRLTLFYGSEQRLEPDYHTTYVFSFPEKEAFRGQHEISLLLPVRKDAGECTATVRFARPPSVEEDPKTSQQYGKLEVFIGGGARFASTENQRLLGATGTADIQLGFGGFWGLHHGLFFDLVIDPYGSHGARRVSPTAVFDGDPSVTTGGLFPTYAYRILPTSWLSVTYFASVSPVFFQLTDEKKDGGVLDTTAAIALRHRLRVAAPYFRFADGTGLSLAASLVHTMYPGGHLGEAPLAGSTLGATLDFLIDG